MLTPDPSILWHRQTVDRGFLDGAPTGFVIFFLVVATFVLVGFVLTGVSLFRNLRNLRRHGIDPLAAESELLVRLTGQRGTEGRPLGERLEELDRLHADGRITAAERDAARARILGAA